LVFYFVAKKRRNKSGPKLINLIKSGGESFGLVLAMAWRQTEALLLR
jgi:hypothetical protein